MAIDRSLRYSLTGSSTVSRGDRPTYALRRITRVFVRPDSDHFPAQRPQAEVGIGVSGPVGLDLFTPKVGIALRPGSMLRTTMPKTPVDEDGDATTREDDVDDTSRFRQQRCV
jgi:hypothetical protein